MGITQREKKPYGKRSDAFYEIPAAEFGCETIDPNTSRERERKSHFP